MGYDRDRWSGFRHAPVCGVVGLVLVGAVAAAVSAQQLASPAALVFDGVTVVDVEQGKAVPAQRVIIAGNRIQAVGPTGKVRLPQGARLIATQGKYLIPGLWDMHAHVQANCTQDVEYPWLIANGITGIRDLNVPSLSAVLQLRREVATGVRVGPRAVVSGPALDGKEVLVDCAGGGASYIKVDSPALARHIVDSLQAAGADLLKIYSGLTRDVYLAVAAEARRVGIPIAGHVPRDVTVAEASDSGQRSVEHVQESYFCTQPEECATLVARFKRNGTWVTPTLTALAIVNRWLGWSDSNWTAWTHQVRLLRDAGLPLLAGTDMLTGFGNPPSVVQEELELLVQEGGLTPLEALQAATLNPATYLHATDSLGTVAAGKLADLVLLDADPLANITNVRKVRAVVANGRYFDRATLDHLLTEAQAKAQQKP